MKKWLPGPYMEKNLKGMVKVGGRKRRVDGV